MQEQLPSLWTLPPGDANYSLRWALIKRSVSMACAGHYHRADWMTGSKIKHRESTFWQRRYWEHCIRDETDFARHVDYIYINPVKHGLVERTADWPFSTFHRDVRKGLFPSNWGIAHDDNATGVGEPL
jgi:putative transposase